jgi:hypothetical protein
VSAFDPTSRYARLATATFETSDGRVMAYVRRRFLPRGSTLRELVEVTLGDGDRLDLASARTIGDPLQFWRVCDANDAMNPFDLEVAGTTLKVPTPEIER